jgi:hypothetical protein
MIGTIFKRIIGPIAGLPRGGELSQDGSKVAIEIGDALEHSVPMIDSRQGIKSTPLASQCFVTGTSAFALPLSRETRERLHVELSSLEESVGLEAYAWCVGHVVTEFAPRMEVKDEAS